jgi:hypothetical protein
MTITENQCTTVGLLTDSSTAVRARCEGSLMPFLSQTGVAASKDGRDGGGSTWEVLRHGNEIGQS